jgi:hypothetical protein
MDQTRFPNFYPLIADAPLSLASNVMKKKSGRFGPIGTVVFSYSHSRFKN